MNVKTSISAFLRSIALGAALTSLLVPSASHAAVLTPSGKTTDYDATFEAIPGPEAPFSGVLQIAVSRNGIITGYWRPAYAEDFVPVTGGSEGQHIWFTIGNEMHVHVDAQFQSDGKLVGDATDYGPIHYKFVATKDGNV